MDCSLNMSAVDLDTYNLSLLTAKEDILNPRSSINWVLFKYDGLSNNLKLSDSGVGGLQELVGKFHSCLPLYGLCRTGNGGCVVLIAWVGGDVDEYRRAECASHVPAVKAFFKEAHVLVSASKPEDVSEEQITAAVNRAGCPAVQGDSMAPVCEDKRESVGTNYKRTIAAMEMRRLNRDSFWACSEREEEERKEEERRRATESRRRWEKERILQEWLEAEEREKRMDEKEQLLQEERRLQALKEKESQTMEKLRWEQQQREDEEEMKAALRSSRTLDKAAEAAELVSQRVTNPREFFRQLSQEWAQSAASAATDNLTHRHPPRSPTDTAKTINSPSMPIKDSPFAYIPTPYYASQSQLSSSGSRHCFPCLSQSSSCPVAHQSHSPSSAQTPQDLPEGFKSSILVCNRHGASELRTSDHGNNNVKVEDVAMGGKGSTTAVSMIDKPFSSPNSTMDTLELLASHNSTTTTLDMLEALASSKSTKSIAKLDTLVCPNSTIDKLETLISQNSTMDKLEALPSLNFITTMDKLETLASANSAMDRLEALASANSTTTMYKMETLVSPNSTTDKSETLISHNSTMDKLEALPSPNDTITTDELETLNSHNSTMDKLEAFTSSNSTTTMFKLETPLSPNSTTTIDKMETLDRHNSNMDKLEALPSSNSTTTKDKLETLASPNSTSTINKLETLDCHNSSTDKLEALVSPKYNTTINGKLETLANSNSTSTIDKLETLASPNSSMDKLEALPSPIYTTTMDKLETMDSHNSSMDKLEALPSPNYTTPMDKLETLASPNSTMNTVEDVCPPGVEETKTGDLKQDVSDKRCCVECEEQGYTGLQRSELLTGIVEDVVKDQEQTGPEQTGFELTDGFSIDHGNGKEPEKVVECNGLEAEPGPESPQDEKNITKMQDEPQ